MNEGIDTLVLARRVQGLMFLLGSLTDSLESFLGRGAEAICARAGRKMGLDRGEGGTVSDLQEALKAVRLRMLEMGIDWPFRLYAKESEPELIVTRAGVTEAQLVFHNCIVRCTLFRYGFPQGMSLCETKHGLFCGLLEGIYGSRAKLDIIHAGENSCLLKLKVFEPSGTAEEEP